MIILFSFVYLIGQTLQFSLILSSFNHSSTQSHFNQDGWTGQVSYNLTECDGYAPALYEGDYINYRKSLPSHSQIKLEYIAYCCSRLPFTFSIDNQIIDQITPDNFTVQNWGNCSLFDVFGDDFQLIQRSHILNHTQDNISLSFSVDPNRPPAQNCIITDVKLYHSDNNAITIDQCADSLDHLIGPDGIPSLNNTCQDFVHNNQQAFNFQIEFLTPFTFDDDCLDLMLKFGNTTLVQGSNFYNQWNFNDLKNAITFNITLDDFPFYNCSESQTLDQYVYFCSYQLQILFQNYTQLTYNAKIQVIINRNVQNSTQINIQQNIVEGHCCENILNITQTLEFCDDFSCTSIIQTPTTVERQQDLFLLISIDNPQFDHYFLKLTEINIGPFIPNIIQQNTTIPGKLILYIKPNIAIPNAVLKIITQLHIQPQNGRFLQQQNTLEQAYETLQNNQYKIAIYSQFSVAQESMNRDDEQGQQDQEEQQNVFKTIKKRKVSNTQLLFIAIAGLVIITVFISCSIYLIKKNKSNVNEIQLPQFKV